MPELSDVVLLLDEKDMDINPQYYKNRGFCFLEFDNHTEARIN